MQVDLKTNHFPSDIEFHRCMFTNRKTKRWCGPQAEIDYVSGSFYNFDYA